MRIARLTQWGVRSADVAHAPSESVTGRARSIVWDASDPSGSLGGDAMGTSTVHSTRLLPDGRPLYNRPLAALPAADYARIPKHLHMNTGVTGRTLQEHGTPVTDVYFPNGACSLSPTKCVMGHSSKSRPWASRACSGSAYFSASVGGPQVPAGAGGSLPVDERTSLCQRERDAGTVSRRPGTLRAGQPPADHARHGLQRAARCEAALLPVVALDPGSRRLQGVSFEAELSRHHARRATSERDAGHRHTTGRRAAHE
jgi:hypothetical protein